MFVIVLHRICRIGGSFHLASWLPSAKFSDCGKNCGKRRTCFEVYSLNKRRNLHQLHPVFTVFASFCGQCKCKREWNCKFGNKNLELETRKSFLTLMLLAPRSVLVAAHVLLFRASIPRIYSGCLLAAESVCLWI